MNRRGFFRMAAGALGLAATMGVPKKMLAPVEAAVEKEWVRKYIFRVEFVSEALGDKAPQVVTKVVEIKDGEDGCTKVSLPDIPPDHEITKVEWRESGGSLWSREEKIN